VAEHDPATVPPHQQLGREGAIEGPQRARVLHRHVRVELGGDARGRALEPGRADGVVVQAAGAEFAERVAVALHVVAQAVVHARSGLGAREVVERRELLEALVRPAFTVRSTVFGGAHERASEVRLDLGLERVLAVDARFAPRRAAQALVAGQEGVQLGTGGTIVRHPGAGQLVLGILGETGVSGDALGSAGDLTSGQRGRAEFLEQQELLGEGLSTKQRTRASVRGNTFIRRSGCRSSQHARKGT
jgi:hypothetical protein